MENEKFIIEEKENKVIILINPAIYSLDAIYDAAYNFLDKSYIILDGDPKKKIEVILKSKNDTSYKELEDLASEFFNELINTKIRREISQKSKKIREYIISTALLGSSKELQDKVKNEKNEEDSNWDNDPLGIATPWEEKNNNQNLDE